MENKNKKVNKTQKAKAGSKGAKKGNKRVKVEEVKQKNNSSVLILCNPHMLQYSDCDIEKDLKKLDPKRFSRVLLFTEVFTPDNCEFTCNWIETATGESPDDGTVITLKDYKSNKFKPVSSKSDSFTDVHIEKCLLQHEELNLFDKPDNLISDETNEKLESWYAKWEKVSGKEVARYVCYHHPYSPSGVTLLEFYIEDNLDEKPFGYHGGFVLSCVLWIHSEAYGDEEDPLVNSITRFIGDGQAVDEENERISAEHLQFCRNF